jgi:integrase
MLAKIQRIRRGDKPQKPYPEFPLTANGNGQWSKKIRGKVYYFGSWADPEAALQEYLKVHDDLYAGRTPRPRGGFTLVDLCNEFMAAKQRQLDVGEITRRTFHDYHRVCQRVLEAIDRNRLVENLDTGDFGGLREKLTETLGLVSLGNEISRIRVLFNFAFNDGHIDRPIRFGTVFKRPSKQVLRRERKRKGPRMFEADEIRRMLNATEGQIKAMILLGINCGFGNHDCAGLPRAALDLNGAWIDYPRPKTGIDRRAPLWSETVNALREALASRPRPKDQADENLVFVTKYGQRWVRATLSSKHPPTKDSPGKLVAVDSISQEMRKRIKELSLKGGRNFYALRHTFETIGGEAKDQIAVDAIMGHVRDDMASLYRERISDDRLRAVVQHVRNWLFGETGNTCRSAQSQT